MQFSFENAEQFKVIANATVEANEIQPIFNRIAKTYVSKVKLPGFRKGKVPVNLAMQQVRGNVYEETVKVLVQQAVTQLYNYPELKHRFGIPELIEHPLYEEGADYSFKLQFIVLPNIELKDLKDINLTSIACEISENDLNTMVESLYAQVNKFVIDNDGVIEDGNRVCVDFKGTIDGTAFEGGSAENFWINISDTNQMIPGFIEQIKGHKVGETFDINVTFPEDYHNESLKSKNAVFSIKVKKRSVLKKASDQEFLTFFGSESFDELNVSLKKNMQRECDNNLFIVNERTVKQALADKYDDFELPTEFLDHVANDIVLRRLNAVLLMNSELRSKANKSKLEAIKQELKQKLISQEIYNEAKGEYLYSLHKSEFELPKPDTDEIKNLIELAVKSASYSYEDSELYEAELRKDEEGMQNIINFVYSKVALQKFLDSMNNTVENKSFSELTVLANKYKFN